MLDSLDQLFNGLNCSLAESNPTKALELIKSLNAHFYFQQDEQATRLLGDILHEPFFGEIAVLCDSHFRETMWKKKELLILDLLFCQLVDQYARLLLGVVTSKWSQDYLKTSSWIPRFLVTLPLVHLPIISNPAAQDELQNQAVKSTILVVAALDKFHGDIWLIYKKRFCDIKLDHDFIQEKLSNVHFPRQEQWISSPTSHPIQICSTFSIQGDEKWINAKWILLIWQRELNRVTIPSNVRLDVPLSDDSKWLEMLGWHFEESRVDKGCFKTVLESLRRRPAKSQSKEIEEWLESKLPEVDAQAMIKCGLDSWGVKQSNLIFRSRPKQLSSRIAKVSRCLLRPLKLFRRLLSPPVLSPILPQTKVLAPLWARLTRTSRIGNISSTSSNGGISNASTGTPSTLEEESGQRLLLLGPGGSGKSTMFKQIQKLYGSGFTRDQTRCKVTIYDNVITSIGTLISESQVYSPIQTEEGKTSAHYIVRLDQSSPFLNPEIGRHIKAVWADQGIKITYGYRHLFRFEFPSQTMNYFLDKIDEISSEKYVPSERDYIECRIRSTRVRRLVFDYKSEQMLLLDAAGQRSERRKWKIVFEGLTAIIFVVALSEYDQFCFEDSMVNRLEDALECWEEMITSDVLKDCAYLLLLNKRDLFEENIKLRPFNEVVEGERSYVTATPSFPYTGRDPEAVRVVKEVFMSKVPADRSVEVKVICATQCDEVEQCLNGFLPSLQARVFQQSPAEAT